MIVEFSTNKQLNNTFYNADANLGIERESSVIQLPSSSRSCYQISGPLQLLQDINVSYYCNDQGIEPDIGVNRAIFYNNEKLMNFLNIE